MMVRFELNSPFEAQHILVTAFARCVPCAGHKEPGIADKPTADIVAKLASGTISLPGMAGCRRNAILRSRNQGPRVSALESLNKSIQRLLELFCACVTSKTHL